MYALMADLDGGNFTNDFCVAGLEYGRLKHNAWQKSRQRVLEFLKRIRDLLSESNRFTAIRRKKRMFVIFR